MPTERADHPDPTMALLLLLTLRIGHALWPEGRDRVRVFDVAPAKQAQRQPPGRRWRCATAAKSLSC